MAYFSTSQSHKCSPEAGHLFHPIIISHPASATDLGDPESTQLKASWAAGVQVLPGAVSISVALWWEVPEGNKETQTQWTANIHMSYFSASVHSPGNVLLLRCFILQI